MSPFGSPESEALMVALAGEAAVANLRIRGKCDEMMGKTDTLHMYGQLVGGRLGYDEATKPYGFIYIEAEDDKGDQVSFGTAVFQKGGSSVVDTQGEEFALGGRKLHSISKKEKPLFKHFPGIGEEGKRDLKVVPLESFCQFAGEAADNLCDAFGKKLILRIYYFDSTTERDRQRLNSTGNFQDSPNFESFKQLSINFQVK